MVKVRWIFFLAIVSFTAFAENTPCSGRKGGVSHCLNDKFVCNDGSISQSNELCVQSDDNYLSQLLPSNQCPCQNSGVNHLSESGEFICNDKTLVQWPSLEQDPMSIGKLTLCVDSSHRNWGDAFYGLNSNK